MRTIFAILLLLVASEAYASDLSFKVLRDDAASIPEGNFGQVRAKWLSDGSLEVRAWTTETAHSSVIDSPASIDAVVDLKTIYLTYRVALKPQDPDPDAPVVFCESIVELVFTVTGLERADYKIIVENASPREAVHAEG